MKLCSSWRYMYAVECMASRLKDKKAELPCSTNIDSNADMKTPILVLGTKQLNIFYTDHSQSVKND